MSVLVTKRDGRKVPFNEEKIKEAILKAFKAVDGEISNYAIAKAENIAYYIEGYYEDEKEATIEEIQQLVENGLMATKRKDVARAYIEYRARRDSARGNSTDKVIQEMLIGENDYWAKENSNKNAHVVTTQRDYIAGITSTDLSRRFLLPEDIVEAHDSGILHFHDMDYYVQNALTNCCLINLEDMLQNGTNINGVMIEKQHRLTTAMTVATQIITAVASSQYGGCTITLTHLAPYVRMSYQEHYAKYTRRGMASKDCEKYAQEDVQKDIRDAVQTFNYQVNSMSTTNGQAPFLSVNMYLNETKEYKTELAMLIEEFLRQRIKGVKNEKGVYITQAFPKLLYVLEEDNIHETSPYWYLTELAAQCTAKRMVPDYISEKKMKELKLNEKGEGQCYPCMGCRSFLTPDKSGKNQYYGRFNQGVVTINLADIGLSANGDEEKFWQLFEERTELCHKALQLRHKRISYITSDAAPILWQHGAFARLEKGESVHSLLHGGYSTLSLGFAALYECVKAMTGYSHTSPEGKEFALKVMCALNDKCAQWKSEEDIDYSLYGSPIESTTYKFAKCLKQRFGEVEGITDRNYITNSYHVHVSEPIDAFSKLLLESEFQALSPGGAISYVEVPNLTQNIPAVLELIKFIYEHIMYAEINTKSDYCQKCGYDGEIQIKGEGDKLYWECPNCGNRDEDSMNVARRTCGYIGSNYWNQGRTAEIHDRVVHLD